ncbi:phosphoribosylglycinamide formyltransferase [Hoeflea prorocentri]|uniref:Phosphoribosylglycinamide formyltransferase n=1 Tax=Hoeflea prorocentri TaxID=1922333 RepID=A0A9X3UGJ6_9HYPH|nr:phosphoribosylglycinamide formyltransferase [Hoeflea prorocentri]MCY6380105.1 phosphoribosylglycinamide formyltransferase [Hoeflea prorocentri]MDA5397905.1 phosphoribosylglycinamide formyltransferase [Hoeflea prorocentri]
MSAGSHKRVAVMISGRGSNLSALISATMAAGYPCRIVGVISDKPDAAGLKLAQDYGIETHVLDRRDYTSREAHEDAVHAALETVKPDIVCLAGYMRLLSGAFVGKWLGSMINIHPSLLPSFRGLDTHERVLAHQVRLHGCSVHFVTEGMDEGPLIAQAAVPVLPGDDAETLAARVLKAEHNLYPSALRLVAEGKVRITTTGKVLLDAFPEPDPDDILYSHDIDKQQN